MYTKYICDLHESLKSKCWRNLSNTLYMSSRRGHWATTMANNYVLKHVIQQLTHDTRQHFRVLCSMRSDNINASDRTIMHRMTGQSISSPETHCCSTWRSMLQWSTCEFYQSTYRDCKTWTLFRRSFIYCNCHNNYCTIHFRWLCALW